jgi:hypothetical protein
MKVIATHPRFGGKFVERGRCLRRIDRAADPIDELCEFGGGRLTAGSATEARTETRGLRFRCGREEANVRAKRPTRAAGRPTVDARRRDGVDKFYARKTSRGDVGPTFVVGRT